LPLAPEMLEELRVELENQLARLERSMSITEEAVRPVQLDQQAVGRLSRMDSLQNQHLSQSLRERELARHGAIRSALARIRKGTFGICTGCGTEIAPGRLFVVPEVEHCPACAA
jgi:DnaK suppressor protein